MNKIIDKLIFLSFIFLPLDSFPFLLKSVYRPASIYFLLLAFPLIICQYLKVKKAKYTSIIILIFYILTSSFAFLLGSQKYNSIENASDFFITLTLGIITYFCYNYYFHRKSCLYNDNHQFLLNIFNILGKVYIFVLIIGIIELLIMIGILPQELKSFFSSYLTGRSSGRIQLTSGEPSWAAMQLLFILPVYTYLIRYNNRFKIPLYIAIILFFLIFSLQGYLMLLFTGILFLFLNKDFLKIFKFLVWSLLGILAFYSVFLFLDAITPVNVYYLSRIKKLLNIDNLNNLLFIDGSMFIRLGFPLIGIMIFLKNPLLGVGGGNYGFEFSSYIYRFFPKALLYPEVVNAIKFNIGNPKNMFSRLLSETGLIGSSLFLFYILIIYKNIKSFNKNDSAYLKFLFCIIMSIYLQFDSFVYIQAWLVFALINNAQKRSINKVK